MSKLKGFGKALIVCLAVFVLGAVSAALAPPIAIALLAATIAAALVSFFRPLPTLWLESKVGAVLLIFIASSCLAAAVSMSRQNENAALTQLRNTNPDAYLAEIKA